MQTPSIGRIVRYILSAEDCDRARQRIRGPERSLRALHQGDEVAAVVVRVAGRTEGPGAAAWTLGLKCFLDGQCPDLWIEAAFEGTEPGTWHWPPRT